MLTPLSTDYESARYTVCAHSRLKMPQITPCGNGDHEKRKGFASAPFDWDGRKTPRLFPAVAAGQPLPHFLDPSIWRCRLKGKRNLPGPKPGQGKGAAPVDPPGLGMLSRLAGFLNYRQLGSPLEAALRVPRVERPGRRAP